MTQERQIHLAGFFSAGNVTHAHGLRARFGSKIPPLLGEASRYSSTWAFANSSPSKLFCCQR